MNKILEALISLFKMLVVTLIIVAGFIGFGRVVNWLKNGCAGVHEDRATEMGLKILGWWLLIFIALFVAAMFFNEYSSSYDFTINLASYWVLIGIIVWFIGLFGYTLSDLPEDSKVES